MFKKQRPARNKKYLEFIAKQKCCCTGHEGNEYHSVIAHHEPEKGKRGLSTKPCDSRAVPLAQMIHYRMEEPGSSRRQIWAEYGVDPEEVVERMRAAWVEQGGNIFWQE